LQSHNSSVKYELVLQNMNDLAKEHAICMK
jgi:hypothetical protein